MSIAVAFVCRFISFRRVKFKPRRRSITQTSISPWSSVTQSYDDSYRKQISNY